MIDLSQKLNYLDFTAKRIIQSVSALYGTSESATLREAVNALLVEAYGSAPQNTDYPADIAGKLGYLNVTKQRLLMAMDGLGYDVSGDITFREAANLLYADAIEVIADNVDVSSLPEYWRQDVKDALVYTLTLGDGYVHHIVLADQHYTKNNMQSAGIVAVLQNTNLFGRIMLLGDNADSNTEEYYSALVEDYEPFAGDLLLVNGNHDSAVSSSLAAYYSGLLEDDSGIVWGDTARLYYYWDDAAHHIRYICLNSSIASAESANQYNFFLSSFNTMPSGWTCIVLSHYALFTPKDKDGNDRSATDGTTISGSYARKLESVRCFSSNPEKFAAWLHGHYHADSMTTLWNMHQFTFNTDSNKPGNRTAGTTAEQAITIFSINPTTGDMQTFRIGYAANDFYRNMAANYRSQMSDGYVYGYYPASGGGFTAGASWVVKLPTYEYQYGVKRIVVYRRDFSSYGACITDFYNDNGVYVTRRSTSSDNAYKLDRHFRYVHLADVSSSNAATQCCVGVQHSSITAENYETEMQNFVFCYEDELPLFTDWKLADAGWVEDYYFQNNAYSAMENAATTDKLVYCEPGQKLTFSVDDPNWSTTWAYFFFFKQPYNALYTQRLGSSSTVKTITVTVPSGCHYYFLSAYNLKGYTDKVIVTVE